MTSPAASPGERRPWHWRDAIVAVMAGLGAAIVAGALVGPDPSTRAVFGVVVPTQAVATLVAVAVLARRRTDWREALAARADSSDWIGLLIGAGLQIGLAVVAYALVVWLFGGEAPTQAVVESAGGAIDPLDRVLVVIGAVLLGPIAEEIVFRGVLLSALLRTRSPRFAIWVSSAAFAGLHLADPRAVFAAPFLFIAGIVMARAVVRTGRLGRAVAIHVGFNLVSVVALLATG